MPAWVLAVGMPAEGTVPLLLPCKYQASHCPLPGAWTALAPVLGEVVVRVSPIPSLLVQCKEKLRDRKAF